MGNEIKKLYKKIKKKIRRKNGDERFQDIFKKYPELNPVQTKGKVLEIYSLMESTKWQRIYSIFFIILTLGLILITGFYAFQTWKLNTFTYDIFESENRPHIFIENVKILEINPNKLKYGIVVSNVGKMPGRLVEIKSILLGINKELPLKKFDKTTLLKPNENRIFEFAEEECGEEIKIQITIIYRGIIKSKNEDYIYQAEIKINKETKNVEILEDIK